MDRALRGTLLPEQTTTKYRQKKIATLTQDEEKQKESIHQSFAHSGPYTPYHEQCVTNAPKAPHTWKLTTGNNLDSRESSVSHAWDMLFHKFTSVVFK